MTQRLCVCQLTNYAKLPADTSTSKNPVIFFTLPGKESFECFASNIFAQMRRGLEACCQSENYLLKL